MGARHTAKREFGKTSLPPDTPSCVRKHPMHEVHTCTSSTCWCGRAARWCVTGRTGCVWMVDGGWMNGKATRGKREQRVK